MIWFTSDTHFGHANVLQFCDRPFATIEAMDRGLVANINACVGPRDHLYILGDFSYKITAEQAREIRKRINCENVHLVPGNHDKDWTQPAVAGTFIVEPPIVTFKERGRRLVLCHYPMVDWQGLAHAAIHLHGHIHAPREYNEWNRANRVLRYDVGVDANDCRPISLPEVFAYFKDVEPRRRATREQWVALTTMGEPDAAGAFPQGVAPSAAELDAQ